MNHVILASLLAMLLGLSSWSLSRTVDNSGTIVGLKRQIDAQKERITDVKEMVRGVQAQVAANLSARNGLVDGLDRRVRELEIYTYPPHQNPGANPPDPKTDDDLMVTICSYWSPPKRWHCVTPIVVEEGVAIVQAVNEVYPYAGGPRSPLTFFDKPPIGAIITSFDGP